MSSESLAALREHPGDELVQLADKHMQHDLTDKDRDMLKRAGGKFSTHATIGTLLGLGLGAFLAFRVRNVRLQAYKTLRATERPTKLMFEDGRTEPLPDLTPYMKPSTFGDIATYVFFCAGGLFIGGETGMLTGSWSAKRTIERDQEAKRRIETAFKRFKADVLRKEAERLEGDSGSGILDKAKRVAMRG
ncbi:hypothetical protein K490DRAFT_32565 [Saccharata proteae CBS 121410]|uniref:Uncharacterized protein n=1 Tax=Saccharata proteae CBS 121410 TaxID=1314787 RepID=A0A9P4I5C5_9PEZI|nr:hypothetical protein K490DRAFT_32565 [Saccharata proteae CBS 121410]